MAIAYDCKIDLFYKKMYNGTYNTEHCVKDLWSSAQKILEVKKQDCLLCGEDYSFIANMVPSCYFLIGSSPDGTVLDGGKVVKCP